MNKERAERIMSIEQQLASLGDDMVAAVHAGQIFEVERICIEIDHLQELRREEMELKPVRANHG